MAQVKINREILTLIVRDLDELHRKRACTCTADPCPLRSRIARIKGILLREPTAPPTTTRSA